MKLKPRPTPRQLLDRIPDVVRCLTSLETVRFAYLFGSLAHGRTTPMSDADFGVYLREGSQYSEEKLHILGLLMDILETDDVDLVVMNTAPLALAMKILESRHILVDKDPHARHLYESKTMRQYYDFAVLENKILTRRYYGGRR